MMAMVLFAMLVSGCSGGGSPVAPTSEPVTESQPVIAGQSTNTFLMGYYDIYFDFETHEFEAVENRTADFTLNIVAFLNQMIAPKNGITFENIVVYNDNPAVFGVDVDFKIFHPLAGFPQYKAFDLLGVLITNGSNQLITDNLRYSERLIDTYMKNPDGYTRWFNPPEFTTELIFGYTPGGWQNHKGTAHLNPYKYYSTGLGTTANAHDFLKNGPNYDGLFQTGLARQMQIDFPMFPVPGILFGYAVVCTWEEHGPLGPADPYHITEALTCDATITPDVYFDGYESGGDIIVDFELFAWGEQPSTIKIESSVLNNVSEFDPAVYGAVVDDHVSTYHIEVGADEVLSTNGQDLWIIAEYGAYDYKNTAPHIPSADGALASFFRYDLPVLPEAPFYQIKIVTPNGFETLIAGEPYDITWTSKNITGNLNIYFSDEGIAKPFAEWELLFGNTTDDGIESWTPGTEHITDHGRILIYSIDFPTEAVDVSNNDFVIGTREIEVLTPNGGETIVATQPYEITWDSQNVDGNVMIEYSTDSGATYPIEIFATTENDGMETWVPNVTDDVTATGRIQITSLNYPTIMDASDEDFTVEAPLKNIDVTKPDGIGIDLCINHTNGDVLILYNDGRVRRWPASTYYASYTSDVLTNVNADFIDMAEDGNWFITYVTGDTMYSMHNNGSDGYIGSMSTDDGTIDAKYAIDAVTVHGGSYIDDHVPVFGYTTSDATPIFKTIMDRIADDTFVAHSLVDYDLNSAGTLTGADRLKYNWIRAAEGDPAYGTVWFVESSDYFAANFDVMNFTYQSIAFGTGVPTADDTGIYDPKDLTQGDSNQMYLLDYCGASLGYRIKAFASSDGSAVTPSIALDNITGTPLRVDGSADMALLVLMSVDGTDTYISVYTAAETP